MFAKMRNVFGPVAVGLIIGSIALVFVFYGVFNPRTSSGLSSTSLAASVNGDPIPFREFRREYQGRVEYFQSMMKGKADPKLLEQLGLARQVIEELVRRKLMDQEAVRLGIRAADQEVREKIFELPYFQKDKKFDIALYHKLLKDNRLEVPEFEDMIRRDIVRAQLVDYMRGRVLVSESEVKDEFNQTEDRRQIEYILIDREKIKDTLSVTDAEANQLLAESAGLKSAQEYYDRHRYEFEKPSKVSAKDKSKKAEATPPEVIPFAEAKIKAAKAVLKDRKSAEVTEKTKKIADEIFAKAKTDLAAAKKLAKQFGLDSKVSEKFNRTEAAIPALGEVPELTGQAFKPESDISSGVKMFESRGAFALVWGLKTFPPALSEFDKKREKLQGQVAFRKEQTIYSNWLSDLRAKAKVDINKQLEKVDVASGE